MNKIVLAIIIATVVAASAGGVYYLEQSGGCDVGITADGSGTVTGDGTYENGETVVLVAEPYGDYYFDGWYDGPNKVSSSERYSFTVNGSVNLTAKFLKYTYAVTVTCDYEEISERQYEQYTAGITGSGAYGKGDTATLTAVSPYGFYFDGWYDGATERSSSENYSFVVNENTNLTAKFLRNQYTLTLSASNYNGGVISGAGTYIYEQSVNVLATVNYGYVFSGWYNGSMLFSAAQDYTFTLSNNMELTARYEIIHDASFTTYLSASEAPCSVTVVSKYFVEIDSRTVTFTDSIKGVVVQSNTSSATNACAYYAKSGMDLKITQTIVYTDGQTATYTSTTVVDQVVKKSFTWKFQDDEWYSFLTKYFLNNKGANWDLNLSYSWYYNYLSDDIVRGYDMSLASKYVTKTDTMIVSMANALRTFTSEMSDLERANCVLKFVQSIEYEYDIDGKGIIEYYKYPAETLWEQKGDCEDHAFLYATLMEAMGYDAVIFQVTTSSGGHAAVGLAVNGASGATYTYNGVTYYYCEATATSAAGTLNTANIGYKPGDYTVSGIYQV